MKLTALISALAILLFTSAFSITDQGLNGRIHSALIRDRLFPALARPMRTLTDLKFRIRGPKPPKNKIVIVAIDNDSLDRFGRWPWHRNLVADLIGQIFSGGARAAGMDMVFSEPDPRVPDSLKKKLINSGLWKEAEANETDPLLQEKIAAYREKLVLGWASDGSCYPAIDAPADCQVNNPKAIEQLPMHFEKFGISHFDPGPAFKRDQTPLETNITLFANLPQYNAAGLHAGSFNTPPDDDGTIRQTNLFTIVNGVPHPSLALEMARIALGDDLNLKLNAEGGVEALEWIKSKDAIPVYPMGRMQINFRGPSGSFTYISALDLLDVKATGHAQALESVKNALVFIGISAVGVFDMRSFPFDSNVAGVEGHATILDNILSRDSLVPTSEGAVHWAIFALMIVGAAVFAFGMQVLEATLAIWVFLGTLAASMILDAVLFNRNWNLNSIYFYFELTAVFGFVISAKYIDEQRGKKFLKSAFGKYVSPAIVDAIVKNPEKLSLGGERRDMTILFSDIRGFTTLSEGMDAKKLSSFLNDYLGIMTGIVFKFEGTLDKYIGDAVMAFWGAPLDQPNHADLAARSALAMMEALAANFDRFKVDHGVEVRIGIGLNSGVVSVGNMGSENNFEYTVIGDHVNLASRLEGLTKMYGAGIVTSRFTLDSIAKAGLQAPPHRVLDQVIVKGKSKSIELIQLFHQKMSPESLKLFEEARTKYQAQAFDEAIELFIKASSAQEQVQGEPDKTCLVYVDRCKEFKQSPPAANWDGGWEMHEK